MFNFKNNIIYLKTDNCHFSGVNGYMDGKYIKKSSKYY